MSSDPIPKSVGIYLKNFEDGKVARNSIAGVEHGIVGVDLKRTEISDNDIQSVEAVQLLFGKARAQIQAANLPNEADVLSKLDLVQQTAGQPGWRDKYHALIASVADHWTILAPTLGPLGQALGELLK